MVNASDRHDFPPQPLVSQDASSAPRSTAGGPVRNQHPKPLIPKETVQGVVRLMAHVVSRELYGKEVTILPIFTGALFFAVDLLRGLEGIDPRVEGIQAKSYTDRKSGELKLTQMPTLEDVEGRDLLVVDDILDTGQTLYRVIEALKQMRPRSIRSAVLLRKRGRQDPRYLVEPDYVGFDIPDYFVVGYGLDDNTRFRNLAYIGYFPDAMNDSGGEFKQVITN